MNTSEPRRPSGARIAIFAVTVCAVLAAHTTFVKTKIREADPERYRRAGRDLRVNGQWRYGYLVSFHGAVLAKVARDSAPGAGSRDSHAPELSATMLRELNLVPLKVIGEAFFYVGLLAYLFFGMSMVTGRLAILGNSRMGRWTRFLAPGALFYAMLAMPLLSFGYGYGGFSNLAGPGAMSWSGPYFHWDLWRLNSGNTISYRAVISPAVFPVEFAADILASAYGIWGPFREEIESATWRPMLWILGGLFYGAALGWVRTFRRANA